MDVCLINKIRKSFWNSSEIFK